MPHAVFRMSEAPSAAETRQISLLALSPGPGSSLLFANFVVLETGLSALCVLTQVLHHRTQFALAQMFLHRTVLPLTQVLHHRTVLPAPDL